MKLIHLSDVHLTCPGDTIIGLDTFELFDAAIAHVHRHHSDAQRVIISGDLVHWGEIRAYERLRDRLSELTIGTRLLMGNHDDRAAFAEVFDGHPVDAHGYVNHSETLDGVKLIFCDTKSDKTHAGELCCDRLAWLEAELQDAGCAHIFMHHNPIRLGLPAPDIISLSGDSEEKLTALISKHKEKIRCVHFGHVHSPVSGAVSGVPFSGVASTCTRLIPEFGSTEKLASAPMEPSYNVILTNPKSLTIHQIPFYWRGPVHRNGVGWEDWEKR